MDNRPIGIFDSGLGGLTVVKQVMAQLENESIIYFGDTARVPYGSKSKDTVTKYSAQIIRFLLEKDVKAIIIACNTVNSNCIEALRQAFPQIPIVGVVEPGVYMAANQTKNGKIGVIGTEATIASGKYPQLIQKQNPALEVYSQACALFVPLVEEGWAMHPVTRQVIKEYIQPLKEQGIDTLILGCTHYPMLLTPIQEEVGEGVTLINPAIEAAIRMGTLLEQMGIESRVIRPTYTFFVSDHPRRMQKMAELFLEYPVEHVEIVSIEEY